MSNILFLFPSTLFLLIFTLLNIVICLFGLFCILLGLFYNLVIFFVFFAIRPTDELLTCSQINRLGWFCLYLFILVRLRFARQLLFFRCVFPDNISNHLLPRWFMYDCWSYLIEELYLFKTLFILRIIP